MAEFIVAIELGSSKITGIAGQKNLDGSINVLAVVKEDSTQCIRKGVVYNIDKTVQCLANIITKLKSTLKTNIHQVYVGVGGQSIRSVINVIPKDLGNDTIISQDMINELMDANRNMDYPELEILDAVSQEYKSFYKNLNKCFDQAGIAIAEMYLAPLALADSVLSEAEKRSGCVLVDLGYDTTTVSVYHKNILRHLAVIPLGANNITKDIASLQMEESEAEKMKLKYASAFTSNSEIDNSLMLPIDPERQVESRKFIEIVEGRLEEIIENVWFQVPSEYTDKLLGGIILTGGGANMKNIDIAFRNHTHIDKIRIANFVSQTINSTNSDINAHNAEFNTVLGLLAKGDMNCAGEEIHNDLFGTNDTTKPLSNDQHKVRQPNDIAGTGVVRTEAEKKAEEERIRKEQEEEEERIRKEQEEEEERLRKERKENSTGHKFMRGLKKFFTTIVSAEEDV